jgi:DNA-binding response OmpR family regulator
VYLPAVAPAATSSLLRPAPPATRDDVPRPRILLVEDNESVRLALDAYLTDEGYVVISAANAEEALRAAADPANPIDVLLTDVVLPKVGGRELAQALQHERPQLRVLFMSGYSPDTKLLEGIAHAGWLAKPFKPEALVQRLGELMRR